LPFSKIEGIINTDLPFGALQNEEWWSDNDATAQGYAWTSAGWRVQSVDLKERSVTFKKQLKEGEVVHAKRRRRKSITSQKPFTPVPVKPKRIRKPSKTRIAKAVARAKNIERKRAATAYSIKFKPKSAYEKRLYKPEAKPTSQD